jgi:hypothetical protein
MQLDAHGHLAKEQDSPMLVDEEDLGRSSEILLTPEIMPDQRRTEAARVRLV